MQCMGEAEPGVFLTKGTNRFLGRRNACSALYADTRVRCISSGVMSSNSLRK